MTMLSPVLKGLIFLPMQSVPITTKLVSSNPSRGEMCSIQHYVIKLVSDFSYIVAVSFIGGGNWSTRRKSLTSFIT
jgi:hypothetical protein